MQIDGKELLITPASFRDAMALKKAIADALRKNGIKIDVAGVSVDEENPLATEIGSETIGNLIENAMAVATDPKVGECLFTCCESVVFGPKREKINEEYFDKPENRRYYYPIMIEVIKANLGPFFKSLGSVLSDRGGLMSKFLKSK